MTASTNFTSGTVVTKEWLNAVDAHTFDYSFNVKDYGAVGDGTTDDTAAFTLAVAAVNTAGGKLILPPGQYVVAAGTIDITYNGVQILGASKGDAAYPTPAYPAPTAIFITGTGAGIRVRSQSVTLKNFRLSSNAARAALSFDLQSPGIRVEAPDNSANDRADRCIVHDVRIDQQPGDGYLSVGPAIYADLARIDIYSCKGFGFRFDPGLLAGLVRTYPLYPGLSVVHSSRVGYCGGHSIACSNNNVVSQTYMAIRMQIIDLDSFGNGQNTSIMYPSADGQFYDFWIFGENCLIEHSAPCGRVGNSLTPEQMGGIWIAGRDHRIINNRFIDTQQPIYWGYKASQPSTGLEVNTFRLVNTSLTHTNMVKVESASARGLRVIYDRRDSMVNVVPDTVGGTPLPSYVLYQGGIEKVSEISTDFVSSITNTGTTVALLDDTVLNLPINGTGPSLSIQGVLVVAPTSVTAGGGIFHIRLNATSPVATKWAGETLCVAYGPGGALTGTTGTDGNVTVSCTNTNIYIENRVGFTIRFTYQLLAFSPDTSI
mgnify:FL=1